MWSTDGKKVKSILKHFSENLNLLSPRGQKQLVMLICYKRKITIPENLDRNQPGFQYK